jgi:hypothetical protein
MQRSDAGIPNRPYPVPTLSDEYALHARGVKRGRRLGRAENLARFTSPPITGEDEPVRVLKNGLWLLAKGGTRFAVLLAPARHYGEVTGIQFSVGVNTRTPDNRRESQFTDFVPSSVSR